MKALVKPFRFWSNEGSRRGNVTCEHALGATGVKNTQEEVFQWRHWKIQ